MCSLGRSRLATLEIGGWSSDGWRSLLYVPAHVPRFVEKAAGRGADAVILDLEDSAPSAEKPAARAALDHAVATVAERGADVLVRINLPMRLAVADIEAAVRPGVAALVVTKVEGPAHLRLLDELVAELEVERALPHGAIRFVPVVESAAAWLEMAAILRALARNIAALLGSEDFALDCGGEPAEETLLLPKQQLIIAARASGLAPLGLLSSVADYSSDVDRFRAVALRSRRFGFAGATCVHPSQVVAVNAAFTPDAAEQEQARRLLAEYEAATACGEGATSVDGMMVDAPVVARARRMLAR